jgi:hypothetical protein
MINPADLMPDAAQAAALGSLLSQTPPDHAAHEGADACDRARTPGYALRRLIQREAEAARPIPHRSPIVDDPADLIADAEEKAALRFALYLILSALAPSDLDAITNPNCAGSCRRSAAYARARAIARARYPYLCAPQR